MSSRTIVLEGLGQFLPPIEPHLMPFHIDYTGSAPLSSYFLVKPCPSPEVTIEEKDVSKSKGLKSRFTSFFRGRKLQGLKVDVPEGYIGVVFSPKITGKETKECSVSRRRATKEDARSTRATVRSVAEDSEESVAIDDAAADGDLETAKKFVASSTFSSFTLWNPDVDVDEGEDEYIRSLTEYQNILVEIHKTDI